MRAWWEAFLISEVETTENNQTQNFGNNTDGQEELFIIEDSILLI